MRTFERPAPLIVWFSLLVEVSLTGIKNIQDHIVSCFSVVLVASEAEISTKATIVLGQWPLLDASRVWHPCSTAT